MTAEPPVHIIETLLSLEVNDDIYLPVWRSAASRTQLFVKQRTTGSRFPLAGLGNPHFYALICDPEPFEMPETLFTFAVIIRNQAAAQETFIRKKSGDGKPWISITHRTLLPGERGKPRPMKSTVGAIKARTIDIQSGVRRSFDRPHLVANPSITVTPVN